MENGGKVKNTWVWAGIEPTASDWAKIRNDHRLWVKNGSKNYPPHNLTGINFSNFRLSNADLPGICLKKAQLKNAAVDGADFTGAYFSGADLSGVDFTNCKIEGANFKEANLSGAVLAGKTLHKIDFSGANLTEANLAISDLENCKFHGCDLSHAAFNKAKAYKAIFSNVKCVQTNFAEAHLSESDFRGASLAKISFQKAILEYVNMIEVEGSEIDFKDADLEYANLSSSRFISSVFTKSKMTSAVVIDSDFEKSKLDSVSASEADFNMSKLFNVQFNQANFEAADFRNCYLAWASFQKAKLYHVNFDNSDLTSANFGGAELTGASFIDCNLAGAAFGVSAKEWGKPETCTLQGTSFLRSNLQLARLQDSEDLMGTQLAGANLTNAVLPDTIAKFPVVESARQAASYARKLFTPLFVACVVLLMINVLAKPEDKMLDFRLMGFKTEIPTVLLLAILPLIILLWYIYLLHYLNKLWETLSTLPARFPDGTPLTRYPDPWFLIQYIQPFVTFLQKDNRSLIPKLASFLIWFAIPLLLLVASLFALRFEGYWPFYFSSFFALGAIGYSFWEHGKICTLLNPLGKLNCGD